MITKRIKIIALFQAEVMRKRRKSQKIMYLYQKKKKKNDLQLKEAIYAFNSALMNDTSTKELIACMREENECTRKRERECFKCECRWICMNVPNFLTDYGSSSAHDPQQLQFLTFQSYQQFNNITQGLSTPASISFNQSLLQGNRGKVKQELPVASYNFRYTSYEFESTSYEFKSTS